MTFDFMTLMYGLVHRKRIEELEQKIDRVITPLDPPPA